MRPIPIVAWAAESALGDGDAAFDVGAAGDTARSCIQVDPELASAGLKKPFVARVAAARDGLDPAASLLERTALRLVADLSHVAPDFRSRRVGVVVGTSSGGMSPLTRALALRASGAPIPGDLARAAPYFGPLRALDEALGVEPVLRVQILAACASSAVAVGLGCRWLELGVADLVVAGGYDAVSTLVAAGFESLGATSASRPAPFRLGRDGMALGEACVLLVLSRQVPTGRVLGYVEGFGMSSDAVHVTAPDRTGAGLARAARAALADADADPGSVDLVSAHATATPFNDAAESRALAAVLGERAADVVVHPFKAVVGHTLGASGALEAAAALAAMARGILPAAAGEGAPDPDAPARLLATNVAVAARRCLKLSAAFGGANAALVLGTGPGGGRAIEPRAVSVAGVGEPKRAADVTALGASTRIPEAQLARLDPLSAAAVAAATSALSRAGAVDPARTGVVVGTVAATLACDEAFAVRLRERGARGVEPRRFPPTSPNLAPGQVSIACGLEGPSTSVGAGPAAALEALLVAHDLVAAGDAEAVVVVAAEQVDDAVRELFLAGDRAVPEDGALALVVRAGEGEALRRPDLVALHEAAVRGGGRLSGRAPGWPSLAAALDALRRP